MIPAGSDFASRWKRLGLGGASAPSSPALAAALRAPRVALPGTDHYGPRGVVRIVDHQTPVSALPGPGLGATLGDWAAIAALSGRDVRLGALDPGSWVFLDTETTSLNSGAGVFVFLVGLGWLDGDQFRVRQILLNSPADEGAMLDAVQDTLRGRTALVSFHGKSFDAPRVDDRFRLSGLDPVTRGLPHWDLLHPSRRLLRGRFEDCRLRTIEERVLGLHRVDDLPGALCPEAWFSFVRGRPHRLVDVFEHNHLDVLTLPAIAAWLTTSYTAPGDPLMALEVGLERALAGHGAAALRDLRLGAGARVADVGARRGTKAASWLRRLGDLDAAGDLLGALARGYPDDAAILAETRTYARARERASKSALAASAAGGDVAAGSRAGRRRTRPKET